MKKSIIIIALSSLFPLFSFANAGGDVAHVLIAYGAAKSFSSTTIQGLKALELPDWQHAKTGVSTELASACGVVAEARLIGNNRTNILFLGLRNRDQKEKVIRPEDVIFRFENGKERRPDLSVFQHLELKPGWQYVFLLPFPSKRDFKSQNKLDVEVPLADHKEVCLLKLVMNRNVEAPEHLRSYTRLTSADIMMNVSQNALSGPVGSITGAQSPTTFGLDLEVTGIHWGLFLGLKTTYLGGPHSTLQSNESVPSDYAGSLQGIYLGGHYRRLLSESTYLLGKIGLVTGSLVFQNPTNQGANKYNFAYSGAITSFEWRHYFARINQGFWTGDYSWGIGVGYESIYFAQTPRGTSFTGHLPHLKVSLGLGI